MLPGTRKIVSDAVVKTLLEIKEIQEGCALISNVGRRRHRRSLFFFF